MPCNPAAGPAARTGSRRIGLALRASDSTAVVEGRELLGGRQAYLVTDRPVAGDGQAGRGGGPWVDGGELLGGGQAHLVTDLVVAGDG